MDEINDSGKPTYPLIFKDTEIRFFQRLDSSLAMATALRKLSLSLWVNTFSLSRSSSPTNVNFQALHNLDLPNLQVIEVKVSYGGPFSSQGRILFEECLRQLCVDLVGESGVADNHITSLSPPAAIYRYRRGAIQHSRSNNREDNTGLLVWPVEE
jgi:hypothetical protein